MIRRTAVRPLTQKETALLEIFADQAVIAIENARLFEAELQRARETFRIARAADRDRRVLNVISRSTVDLQTVLDTLVESVARLCRVDQAYMLRRRDDKYHNVAVSRSFARTQRNSFSPIPVCMTGEHWPAGSRWSVEWSTFPM